MQAHKAPVADSTFHPSGGFVATASAVREVRVWDVDAGCCTHCFSAHKGIVLRVLFHSHQPILATSGDDGLVNLWDLQKKKLAAKLCGHVSAVTALAWAAGETHLLSAGRDKVVTVWDIRTHSKVRTVAVLESIEALLVLPDSLMAPLAGKEGGSGPSILFATGGEAGAVKCWSARSGRCVYKPATSRKATSMHSIVELLPLATSSRVLVASADCALTAMQLHPDASADSHTLLGHLGEVTAAAFLDSDASADSNSESPIPCNVALATNSDMLYMLDTHTLACVRSMAGHSEAILSVASVCVDVAESQWLVASGAKDNTIRVWHASTGRCIALGEGHMGSVTAVTFFPKQSPALLSSGADKLIQVWDLAPVWEALQSGDLPDSPIKISVSAAVAAHEKEIHCVAVSPTNAFAASGGADRVAKVWRLPALSAPVVLAGHRRGVWDVQFAPIDQVCTHAC